MSYLLIAEDDEDDCLLAEDAWLETAEHIDPFFVNDGESLLRFVQEHPRNPPALILLDLNMPIKDGREALEQLKKNQDTCQIPVVVFTTSNHPKDIQGMYARGASGFITKPASYEELLNVMQTLKHYWFDTVKLPAL